MTIHSIDKTPTASAAVAAAATPEEWPIKHQRKLKREALLRVVKYLQEPNNIQDIHGMHSCAHVISTVVVYHQMKFLGSCYQHVFILARICIISCLSVLIWFYKTFLTFTDTSKTAFQNRKLNNRNKKRYHFSNVLCSNQKASFTKCV